MGITQFSRWNLANGLRRLELPILSTGSSNLPMPRAHNGNKLTEVGRRKFANLGRRAEEAGEPARRDVRQRARAGTATAI